MPLFSLPSAQEIRDDARLRTEQISTQYLEAQVLTDLDQKISEAYAVVKGKLLDAATPYRWPLPDSVIAQAKPTYTEAERADWTKSQRDRASLIVKLLALARVYELAGQLDPSYTEKANDLKKEANLLLSGDGKADKGLVGAIAGAVDEQPGEQVGGSFSRPPRRTDGYSRDGECEYSRGSYGGGWR